MQGFESGANGLELSLNENLVAAVAIGAVANLGAKAVPGKRLWAIFGKGEARELLDDVALLGLKALERVEILDLEDFEFLIEQGKQPLGKEGCVLR